MNADEVSDLLPFDQRYELRSQLPCDGPYQGWHAFDRLLNREVRVNVAYEHLADVGAFLSRVGTHTRLRHPNLIPVYDLGITDEKLPFFTQAWIEVTDLNRLMSDWEMKEHQRPASPLLTAVRYLRAACNAVEFVHQHGYVFVHLNPGRIVVNEPLHEVFVTDELVDPKSTTHEVGRIFGNPAFMASEQLTGPIWPTTASDIYGLGGILYWILYGHPPNRLDNAKSTVQVLVELAERKTPPPRLKPRPIFTGTWFKRRFKQLQDIALHALEPLPERRPKTVANFAERLDEWMARN